MNQPNFDNLPAGRLLNTVALQYAVLCAECDVVSDSPHDICMVCGSRSLVNICRILGGKMPKNRAVLLKSEPVKITREGVLHFRRPHRVRRQLSVLELPVADVGARLLSKSKERTSDTGGGE